MRLADIGWLLVWVVASFTALYGLGRLSRWHASRSDPIDTLIRAPKWCKDGAGWMNTADQQKVERAGEARWQETLRAQRKTRKPVAPRKPTNQVIELARRRA